MNSATKAVIEQKLEIREAGININIPEKTLRMKLISKEFDEHQLRPSSCLGRELEIKLALHSKRLQAEGFAPSRKLLKNWRLMEQSISA